MRQRTPRLTALLAITAWLLATACSRGSLGAGTTSATYQGLSAADRQSAVVNLQAAHHDSSPLSVAEGSVSAYCLLHAGSSEIQGVYGG